MDVLDLTALADRFALSDWEAGESARLAGLIVLFLELPDPPDPDGFIPEYARLRDRLATAVDGGDADEIEERFLDLYTHLHMNQAPYNNQERSRMDAAGGYWNHAGGLSPILKAETWISPDTVSADFGAGNGFQGLLLCRCSTLIAKTVQIEISARMTEIGEGLREPGSECRRTESSGLWATSSKSPRSVTVSSISTAPSDPEGSRPRLSTRRFAREVESEDRPSGHLLHRRLSAGLPLGPIRGVLRRRPPHLLSNRDRQEDSRSFDP